MHTSSYAEETGEFLSQFNINENRIFRSQLNVDMVICVLDMKYFRFYFAQAEIYHWSCQGF